MWQLWKWLTVVLDIVLTTIRKNEKTNSGETNSQNGMFKLTWRGNVNFTRTQHWLFIKVFERDLPKFFFSQIASNIIVLFYLNLLEIRTEMRTETSQEIQNNGNSPLGTLFRFILISHNFCQEYSKSIAATCGSIWRYMCTVYER